MKPIQTSPELLHLIDEAKGHVMTREEICRQRVSFVFGQGMDSNSKRSREEVEASCAELYGLPSSARHQG